MRCVREHARINMAGWGVYYGLSICMGLGLTCQLDWHVGIGRAIGHGAGGEKGVCWLLIKGAGAAPFVDG